ncbi:MAG TPA: hypothetical protein DCZ45_07370 [Parabacteroides goldsteinii]|nr:hypothetical protein [Parabacteroides goldsteinii]
MKICNLAKRGLYPYGISSLLRIFV